MFIYCKDYDIIAITETWLSNTIYTNEIFPYGYNVFRRDRDGRGGGVLLAVKNTIHTDQLLMPKHLEVLSCNITLDNFSFYVCLIYRPPNSNEASDALLVSYLDLLDNSKNLLILGDLNLPDIDWDTYTGSFGTSSAIADLAYNYNMHQLVSDTTHIMGNTLDVILTNSDSFCDVEVSSKLPHGLSSDRYMITFFNKHILSNQILWPNTYLIILELIGMT